MDKPDARLLNPTIQNYLRQQAIWLREQGKRIGEMATALGVHRTTVSGWWGQYQQEGKAALKQQPRGAKFGEGRTLSPAEEATVQGVMPTHFPDELNIDSALWTRQAVQSVIACECDVEMPIRTVGEDLKRWGYTPQKPLKRAYEQDPLAVKAWLETEYPAIEQRAQQQEAEIAWGDESGLRSDAQAGRA
jgi:transposase